MRLVVNIVVFLMLVDEGDFSQTLYAEKMFAPFGWVTEVLIDPLPIKIRPLDLVFLIALVVGGSKGTRIAPMRNSIFLALATTIFFFVLGVLLRGGDSKSALWQVYLMLMAPMAALAISGTHRTQAHYKQLAKWVLAAGLYRAGMVIIFYMSQIRGSLVAIPPHMSTHADSVLWVVSISILVVNFLERRTRASKLGAFVGVPAILAAVQFNNRRLAFVSLVMALGSLYFLLPPSAPKRRLQTIAKFLAPVLAIYVIVGWGRTEKIFKPLASFTTVASKPDASTLARNVENLSLIATAQASPPTGTGWGHPYIELSNKYSIAHAMKLWPYVPHNSILGMLAYSGFLGVLGYWMMFPTAIFLHARSARLARDANARSAGLICVMATVTCMNQMFGDMGIFSSTVMYMMSLVWAAAMRLPIEAGVWPTLRPAPEPEPEPEIAAVGEPGVSSEPNAPVHTGASPPPS